MAQRTFIRGNDDSGDYWSYFDFISDRFDILRSDLLDKSSVSSAVSHVNICLIPQKFHLKDLHEVGFDGKRSVINRARRLRKIGSKIPPPFPNGWFAIAESGEIKPGSAKSVNCLGENFVAFRSLESKEVFVLDAYCPHMGANLGVGGIVQGDCIECPFHQWRFRGDDGNCVHIPYSKSLAESKLELET